MSLNSELCNVAVSQLSDLTTATGIAQDSYFLFSEPQEQSIYGYLSKKVQYARIRAQLFDELSIYSISDLVESVDDIYKNYLATLSGRNEISVDSQPYPYIISSMTEINGKMRSLGAYKLRDAMESVFGEHEFSSCISACNSSSDEPTPGSTKLLNSDTLARTMSAYFMPGYTKSNQLAHKDFVNSSIEHVAAYFITKKHTGEAGSSVFQNYADLSSSEVSDLYSGISSRCPTRNDYCVILSDETHPDQTTGRPSTTRYVFTELSCDKSTYRRDMWTFQYVVNSAPLTDAQWKAINSGITDSNWYSRNVIDGYFSVLCTMISGQIDRLNAIV